MSDVTKSARTKSTIFGTCSILATLGPCLYCVLYALITATPQQQSTIAGTALLAIILTAVSLIFKLHMRSVIFIILIGLGSAMGSIMTLLEVFLAFTLSDELIFTPLHKYYRNQYQTNREIDKRFE